MKKIIGYVSTKNLTDMREQDIKSLDIINIAFGHVIEDSVVWNPGEYGKGLEYIRKTNPTIKLILSVGGWSSGGFSEAAMTQEGRDKFASSAADIVTQYGLDGIDVDWEYPGTSLAGIKSDPKDKENFTLLLKTTREKLDTLGKEKMLTIAAGGDTYFTLQMEVAEASKYLDYIQLMTYDLQGGFQHATGHHAALYQGRRNLSDACMDKAVKVFTMAGLPMEKVVVGVPFYSRKWDRVKGDGDGDGLGMEAETVGGYGPDYGGLTNDYINKNGFTRYWDEEAKAPYLFNGTTFISYEDEESLLHKVNYVKESDIMGIMFWEYQCDPTGTLIPYLRNALNS